MYKCAFLFFKSALTFDIMIIFCSPSATKKNSRPEKSSDRLFLYAAGLL